MCFFKALASGFLSISSKKVFGHSFLEELIEKIITNVLAYFVLLSATKKNVFKALASGFLRIIPKKGFGHFFLEDLSEK
jgi:hypothetical protein